MLALAAVQPDRIGGIDRHAEHTLPLALRHGEEAREDGGAAASTEGHAGRVEAGLHDRVVAWVEVEVDGVARGGGDGIGGEDQPAVADVDVVDGASAGGGGGRGGAAAVAAAAPAVLGGDLVEGGEQEGEGEEGDWGEHVSGSDGVLVAGWKLEVE